MALILRSLLLHNAGHLKAETGNYVAAIMCMACVMLAASVLVAVFPMPQPEAADKQRSSSSGKGVVALIRDLPSEDVDIEKACLKKCQSSSF